MNLKLSTINYFYYKRKKMKREMSGKDLSGISFGVDEPMRMKKIAV